MWKKLLGLLGLPSMPMDAKDVSIQRLVSANSLNRRKNARVRYPHFGAAGLYPQVFYMGTEMIVGNISVGGMLVIDDTEKFGTTVGEIVNLSLVWIDLEIKMRTRIVGANLERRHLQFVDFNPQAYLRISQLIKPGYLGGCFHRVRNDSGQLQVDELWVGPNNETLVIEGENSTLTFREIAILFKRGHASLNAKTQQPISESLLNDSLILLANLPQPTERVKTLLELVESELKVFKPRGTGTYG